MAFFPCIYFTGSTNPCYYRLNHVNYRGLTNKEKIQKMIERSKQRQLFYELLIKMVGVCIENDFRLIIENPYNSQHYLCNNFFSNPTIIDNNRRLRGDYFMKPTGYWFFNCEPTYGKSYQEPIIKRTISHSRPSKKAGVCSEERSMISPDYARNFICDFIIGKTQKHSQLKLF